MKSNLQEQKHNLVETTRDNQKKGVLEESTAEIYSNAIKRLVKNEKLSFVIDKNSKTHQLIIGDNYDALLNLLCTHKDKIDLIYIDPPYGKDEVGAFADTNYHNAISRDDLLSMLEPRLQIAKQLLSKKGVIFVSIDDKNMAYIKCLLDEVFNETNYIATFDWMKTATPPSLSKHVRKKYEYVLCYAKSILDVDVFYGGISEGGDMPLLNAPNRMNSLVFRKDSLRLKIEDGVYPKGKYGKVYLEEDFVVEQGRAVNDLKLEGTWKWSQDTVDKEIAQGTVFWVKSNKFSVRYAREGKRIKKPSNIISKSECNVATNEEGKNELLSIIKDTTFSFPKPVSLISYLVNMNTYNKPDAIVLDFFAGSGTTGQAVLELNRQDGGNRTFICCTNNEESDDFIAYNVTSKRLKRIMTGSCYDGTDDFDWLKDHSPYGDNLEVLEIEAN